MKRWAIGLCGVGLVVGLGWLGFSWARNHFADDSGLPDLSKGPVNAEAAGLTGEPSWQLPDAKATDRTGRGSPTITQTISATDASAGSTASDPFNTERTQTAQPAGRYGRYGDSAGDANSSTSQGSISTAGAPAGQRYGSVEPAVLAADGTAIPLAADVAAARATDLQTNSGAPDRIVAPTSAKPIGDDIPTANDAGMTATGAMSRADQIDPQAAEQARLESRLVNNTPSGAGEFDRGLAKRASPSNKNELRINDSNAKLASGTQSAQGNAADSSGDWATDPAMASRLNNPRTTAAMQNAAATGAGDYRSQMQTGGAQNQTKMGSGVSSRSAQTGAVAADALQGGTWQNPPAAATGNSTVSNSLAGSALATAATANSLNPTTPLTASSFPPIDASNTAISAEGYGKPGDKKLEGAQTPSVTIEKIAPPEIQVGKPAKFQVLVKNTGPMPAENVEVTDLVPQGTTLMGTTPRTMTGTRGEILWKVGDLKPGEESKLEVDLMPIAEGEIGSTASVQFRSAASARTVATKPDLVLELTSPKQVMIGENITIKIKLSNPGTGIASKVVLQSRVPPQLQHPAGSDLEFEVGQFRPGESRDLELTMHAVQAGQCMVSVAADGDANLHVSKQAAIEVVAPRLEVALAGPGLRYLDRQAKYTVSVSNPGTASARDINLVTRLPKGMKFVDASDLGHYDSNSNTVMWALDELPAGANGSVTLTALATDAGEQKLRSEVKGSGGLSNTTEQVTMVEGVAAVEFTIKKLNDPVEVGEEASYEIHIVNNGSKAANRLQLLVVMPDGIKPIRGEGPSKQAIDGQRLAFEPVARLAPKGDITYRVTGQCSAAGDLRIKVLLQTDEMSQPVTKEESTRVYKD